MAIITSYATLQTAVADYLAKDNLTAFIPNFIQNAENKIYRRYNIRDMETAFSDTISSGVISLPARYNKLKRAQVDGTPIQKLIRMDVDFIYEKYPNRSGAEKPHYIGQEGGNFVFGPFPADHTISGIYYRRYEPLRTTDPNWYVTNAPEVLLYASLLEAEPFIKNDPRVQTWSQLLQDSINSITDSEMEEEFSGSDLQMEVA